MERRMLPEVADRIRQMEQCFDLLQVAVNTAPDSLREDASLREMLRKLTQYYESGLWLRDYELDEKGLLPQTLKRGVLAQDTLYDFLDKVGDFAEAPDL